ncbi:hypothetical protein ABGB18_40230 [Nonomuraea sp. B12E4]|uniref:hypothetical protein n=1 Tax=Nonomuraea sp. B12E4 TaxID=3153564 RepID=UPI00325CC4F4
MRRTLIATALIASFAAAGCGSAPGGTEVASVARTTAAAASASPTATVDQEEQGRKFAQCMREHGIPMEDPGPDGGGGLKSLGGKIDKKALQVATGACRDFAPSKIREPSSRNVDQIRVLAQCLREHGVNMPDPNPDGSFPSGTMGSIQRDGAKFQEALKACNKAKAPVGAGG